METQMQDAVGVIYGNVGSTDFDVAIHGDLRRLDYISVDHSGRSVLAQVQHVVRKTNLSFEDAVSGASSTEDKLSGNVHVIGFMDPHGRVQVPRTPFKAGEAVYRADDALVQEILGLEGAADGAYLGHVKGSSIPVRLSMNMLAQKHVSVLAKTGAGKSYTVGVILEEFLNARVPLVILDPHGEYGSLRNANVDPAEVETMTRFGSKPRSFAKQVKEYALDTFVNPDAEKLRLEGMNLTGRELVDLMGGSVKGSQMGLLYQAVKEVTDHLPAYTLKDIMDAVARNKAATKWNVLNSLEALEATGLFHVRGNDVRDLVRPAQCSIINLKGVAPDIQEVLVTRLTSLLWESRKRGDIPPFILVCEEAHNFCPERGVGNAISGPILRTVASEGRKFGMGLVIVSQRPAKIDKNVLSQCNTQVVLKVTNPNDLKAIVSSVEGITTQTADEVQRLAIGSALVAGGGLTQPVFVEIRPRMTSHGGRSIEVVEDPANPATARPKPAPRPIARRPDPVEPIPRMGPAPGAETEAEPVRAEPTALARKAAPTQRPTTPSADSSMQEIPLVEGELVRPGRSAKPSPADSAKQPPSNVAFKAEPVKTRPAASAAAPDSRPNPIRSTAPWSKADVPAIARVAERVGIITTGTRPERAIEVITRLAHTNHRSPDARLGLYAEIARRACHADAPACIRCPLADQCEFHASIREERSKSRSGIRRLWNR